VDWYERRELIRTLVKRVEIDQERVNVVFRVEDSMGSTGNSRFLQHCRGRVDRPLGRSLRRFHPVSLLQHSGLEPLDDQPDDALVTDPMFHKADQPIVADRVKGKHDTLPISKTFHN